MCQLGWSGLWGRMDTPICNAEFLRSSPETTTTLLTGYTSIQNKKLKVKKKKKKENELGSKQQDRSLKEGIINNVKNTGVGCHFLLQGIFLTQGLNTMSPALQADSLRTELPENPTELPGRPHQHCQIQCK